MGASDLINKINNLVGGDVHYLPYNIKNTKVTYGVPPVPIRGIQSLFARHSSRQVRRVGSLTSKSVFVSNKNQAGVIGFVLMAGTVSCAAIEVMALSGIPFPITGTDVSTGGSGLFLGTACRPIGTPEFRREAMPGFTVYTFEVDRLIINQGVRLSQ
ncbi:MAG: hypothetical protein GY832_08425 [Chloroflexi bacterium]|nr:hypothetical protein [Chloroflexota bacterium]